MELISIDMQEEAQLRVSKVQSKMREHRIDAMLVADNANIFYLAGVFYRGYVYVPIEGEAIYFVIRPNIYTAGNNVIEIRKPEQIKDILSERGIEVPQRAGLEVDSLSYSDIKRLSKALNLQEVENGSAVMREARMVKTEKELNLMREDGGHQAAAYHRITRCYKEGMTDVEFQIEIERILRKEGCLGFLRTSGNLMEINMGSVISGENADTPTPYDFSMGGHGTSPALPVGADGTTMKHGSTVMVDMNGSFNGYQTDMTRVWRIGEIPEIAYKAHECSRRILRELETLSKPGVKCSELYHRAIEIAEEENLDNYFMGHIQKAAFIGHGVGIELNEQPAITARNATELQENMTLAIEPKFVIPKVGAVGVENTYVVTKEGLKTLTDFPEEIQEL